MNTKIEVRYLRNVDLAKSKEQTWGVWVDGPLVPLPEAPGVVYAQRNENLKEVYFEIRHGDRCWCNGFFDIKDPKALKQLRKLANMVQVLAN